MRWPVSATAVAALGVGMHDSRTVGRRLEVPTAVAKMGDERRQSTEGHEDWCRLKCTALYGHVYDKYYGDGRSVYAAVA